MDTELDDLLIVRTVSLTSALERKIKRLVITGELEPGARLNENQLSSRFGTSRGPLREALRSLEAKGFLQSVRNRGVFVRKLSIDEAREVYEVRAVLFGLAGRLAAQRITEGRLSQLKQLMAGMDDAAGIDDVDTYYALNLTFHSEILEAAGNGILQEEYERLVARMHLFRVKGLILGGGLAVSNDEHARMVAALEAGDADRAEAAHMAHVAQGKQRVTAAYAALPSRSKA